MNDPRVTFVQGDIADRAAMERVFAQHRPRAVLNLAAETHVDRSIDGATPFIETNIVGTFVLLELAVALTKGKLGEVPAGFRFLHVSTDEVYGTLGPTVCFMRTRRTRRIRRMRPARRQQIIWCGPTDRRTA